MSDLTRPFDPEHVRARFGGLTDGDLCLDNAGGSFVLRAVGERVAEYLSTTPVQLGGSYARAQQAGERQRAAVEAAARLINADPDEVVFGPSSTALLDALGRSLGADLAPGDEVIVTDCDHESNIGPWRRLAERGVVVREWQVDRERHGLDLAGLDALLSPRTRIVAVTQVSNLLGRIEPVTEIARRAHAVGAQVVVDGVAWAPHRAVDVRALGADWYVFSWYKVYGPHLGLLWGRRERLQAAANINHAHLGREAVPYKLQPGGVCYELAWGTTAVGEYFAGLGGAAAFAAIARHEEALARVVLDGLAARGDATLYGPREADAAVRLPIVSFRLAGWRSQEVAEQLAARGVGVKYGNFHAKRLTDAYGLDPKDGVVRASFAHYNTLAEAERLVAALGEACPPR